MRHQRISQEESYSFRCSTTFLVDQKTMKNNVWRMTNSFLCMQKVLETDNGYFLVLVLKRSGTVSAKTVHKEYGTIFLKGCWWNSQKSDCSIFRATGPLSRGRLKSKGHGKLSIHHAADSATIEIIFRIIVSAEKLSLYGAIAEMCRV